MPRLLASLLLVTAAACGGETTYYDAPPAPLDASPLDATAPVTTRVGLFGPPTDQLDVLFVIDNSSSMAEEQGSLLANFPLLVNALANFPGGLPDLHIGVVSSNMGVGPYAIAQCGGGGDNGQLQATPRIKGCNAPTDAYLVDVDDGSGGRTRNYAGNLTDAFSCIAQLGDQGCGFEQHLQSMRRALDGSNAGNAGFLRDDAALLVVFLADEDDCSAFDTGMFDPSDTSQTGPLGPLSSFRCFEFGVECDVGNDDPRAVGPRSSCRAQADSPFVYGTDEFRDFLYGLKGDPSKILISAIVGNAEPVAVEENPNMPPAPQLAASCVSASGNAAPGVRFASLLAAFPGRAVQSSICNENLASAVAATGQLTDSVAGRQCLIGDAPASIPSLYASCSVADVTGLDSDSEVRVAIESCNTTGNEAPCFRFVPDATCSLNPAGAKVEIDRAAPAPADSVVVVECL